MIVFLDIEKVIGRYERNVAKGKNFDISKKFYQELSKFSQTPYAASLIKPIKGYESNLDTTDDENSEISSGLSILSHQEIDEGSPESQVYKNDLDGLDDLDDLDENDLECLLSISSQSAKISLDSDQMNEISRDLSEFFRSFAELVQDVNWKDPKKKFADRYYFVFAVLLAIQIKLHNLFDFEEIFQERISKEELTNQINNWNQGLDIKDRIPCYNSKQDLARFNALDFLYSHLEIHGIKGLPKCNGKKVLLYLSTILIDNSECYSPGGNAKSFSKMLEHFYHMITNTKKRKNNLSNKKKHSVDSDDSDGDNSNLSNKKSRSNNDVN